MEYLVPYNEWVETCSEEWSDHGKTGFPLVAFRKIVVA